jgi:5'-nucleotidase / UDP-sugar diphosphatase
MSALTIFHTCDLHGRLDADRAAAIRKICEAHPGSLLLDAGDAVCAGNLSPGLRSERILPLMAETGYTAMAMGNRETHPVWSGVRRKLRGLQFPILSSNLFSPRPPVQRLLLCQPSGGLRAGLFALTPVMTRRNSAGSVAVSVVFDDPLDVAQEMVRELRPQVDVLVCLCHLGRKFDQILAAGTPGIDVIIGAHDHSPGLPYGERIGATLLARSSPYGRDLGKVSLATTDSGLVSSASLITL